MCIYCIDFQSELRFQVTLIVGFFVYHSNQLNTDTQRCGAIWLLEILVLHLKSFELRRRNVTAIYKLISREKLY